MKGNLLRLYAPSADKRAQAIAALGNLAEKAAPAVPFLIGIADSSSTEGKEIRQALVKIGAAAVEPLLPALRDPDRQVRSAAAWVLGELKDPRAVAAVAELLHDEERMVREAAAKALGEIGADEAIGPLFTALRDKEVSLRQYAAKSLGKIGAPVLAQAIALLNDPDVDQRRYAAWILGDLKDPRAVEPITIALRGHTESTPDQDVYETVMALVKVGFVVVAPLLPHATGLAGLLAGKVDRALIDRYNYHYADRTYKEQGLQSAMTEDFYQAEGERLRADFERAGIPCRML